MVEVGKGGVVFELAFPEVFARGDGKQAGFDAVLGNPPWDALQPYAKEFFASFDLRVLDAPTRKEREVLESELAENAVVAASWEEYSTRIDAAKRIMERLSEHGGKQAGGHASGANSDVWQIFAERGVVLLGHGGSIGYVLPSAFHANQSATGLRQLYLEKMALRCCFSFENRKKLFDIDSRYKFAAVVARKNLRGTREFECGFYWYDLERLFDGHERLRYTAEFVRRTGGEYYTLLELRAQRDVDLADTVYSAATSMGRHLSTAQVRCGEEIHMTKGSHRFTSVASLLPAGADLCDPDVADGLRTRGYLPLHEGKTFHQYDDRWEAPRYLVGLKALADRPTWLRAAQHYRLAFRDIARSTDERTAIFCLLPPGVVCGNKAPCEREPHRRTTCDSLSILSVANSFVFDFVLRLKVQATVNLFILNSCPFPTLDATVRQFLAHSAVRLSCNDAAYAPLWTEQLGDSWRESTSRRTWPVLDGGDARWVVRSAIDAVVADAYGLNRAQYEQVLSTFNHKSYPKALKQCLAAFDELKAVGLDAFTKNRDPYWDIPLNESLPKPVIALPIPGDPAPGLTKSGSLFDWSDEETSAPDSPTALPTE